MSEPVVGVQYPISASSADRDTGLFIRALVYESPITALSTPVETIDLVHIDLGLYVGLWNPANAGVFLIHAVTYTDGTYTAPDLSLASPPPSVITAHEMAHDTQYKILRGHHGENVAEQFTGVSTDGMNPSTANRKIFNSDLELDDYRNGVIPAPTPLVEVEVETVPNVSAPFILPAYMYRKKL